MTGNGTAPQIDARQLLTLRKRRFAEAGKALSALYEVVMSNRGELEEAGDVPPGAALRKAADKYLQLLGALDIIDSVLTPEALEAMTDEPYNGTVAVDRGDLILLTEVVGRTFGSAVPGEDSPLGRLTRAGGPGSSDMAELAAMAAAEDA